LRAAAEAFNIALKMEYRLSKRRIYPLIACGVVVGAVPWPFLAVPLRPDSPLLFLAGWSFFFLALAFIAFLEYRRWRLVITDAFIELITPSTRQNWLLHQVKGFRRLPDGFILEANDPMLVRPLKIPTYVADSASLEAWIQGNFKDLAILEAEQAQAQALADERLGANEFERQNRLDNYKIGVRVLDIAAVILVLVSRFNVDVVPFSALLPFFCYWLMWRSKGRVMIDIEKEKGSVSITLVLVASCVATALGPALKTPDLMDWEPLLPFYIMVSLVALMPLLYISWKYGNLRKGLFALVVVCGVVLAIPYGIGVGLYVNYRFVAYDVRTYTSVVTEKRVSRGKHTTYYVEFQPVGPLKKPSELQVSQRNYASYKPGGSVRVTFGRGLLGATWYGTR